MVAVGRNDPCPCGSGKKYKKCCGSASGSVSAQTNKQYSELENYRATAVQFQRAGQFAAAVKIYQKVVRLDNKDADALFELGRLQGLLNPINSAGLAEAIDCLKKSVALRPNDIQAILELCRLQAKNFDMHGVIQSTDKALSQFPDNTALMNQRGNALAYLDRKQEAIEMLERANALAPLQLDIVTTLAGVYIDSGAHSDAQSLLSSMAANLEFNKSDTSSVNESNINDHAASIYYKLGSVEDKLGNYAEAAKAIEVAGHLQLQSADCKNWDKNSGIQTITEFTAEVAKQNSWAKNNSSALNHGNTFDNSQQDKTRLVFFVGFPRSGTTLTEQLLAAHSEIATSEERVDLGYAIESLFTHYKSDYQQDAVKRFNQLSDDDIKFVRSAYWQSVGIDNQRGGVYLDKLPLNISHIPWIQKVFPDAKLIVALRDPRDVCLSCYFQHFASNVAMNHFLQWQTTTRYYRYVMSQWLATKEHLEMDWLETRYEDTVADIESQARKLIEFVGLDWQPEVLSYRDALNNRAVATPSNAAIRQPLNTKAIERWRNYPELADSAKADLASLVLAFAYQW